MQNCPYSAKVIDKIDNGKGYWEYLKIGVFNGETQIGEYIRNYPSFFDTFHPFEINKEWFALYSKHYTATRIMKLPSCEDIGGEEPHGHGFCPTEYHVPVLTGHIFNPEDPYPKRESTTDKFIKKVPLESGGIRWFYPTDSEGYIELKEEYQKVKEEDNRKADEWNKRNPIVSQYAKWGFVGGCYWADDSSSKIQFLDLSKANEGIIVRDDRFGYIEIPSMVQLKDAINTDGIDYIGEPLDKTKVKIALPISFTLDGTKLNED